MTAPGSFTVGQVLTAADMNEFGAWTTTTTPTLTNITKGNATTWYMKYYRMQNIGFLSVNLTLGSTSTVTGDITITLPSGWAGANQEIGMAHTQAAGTSYYSVWRMNAAGTALLIRAANSGGTYLSNTNTSGTVPGTWTTGDFIRFTAMIELS